MRNTNYLAILTLAVPLSVQAFDQSSPPNSLVVDTTGFVGVGTEQPTEPLHVLRDDGNSSALIEEKGTNDSTQTRARTLLRMINNGGPNFSFQDSSTNEGWQFAMTNNGDMAISKELTGGSEFIVQKTGRVRMGPGPVTNFDLRDNGDLIIPNGSVTANGVLLTSSRDSKTDIKPIDTTKVLQNISELGIAEWRYKKADKNDRHISPMAEDFYSLFKLGPDDKHINPNDLASVALVAVQELTKNSETLKSENAELKERLLYLEKLVTKLVSVDRELRDHNKVALRNPK